MEGSDHSLERPAGPLRVLIVEDNADSAFSLSELLNTLGFESCIAADGAAAIQQAFAFQPDVILLDIGLPVMDGYHVARLLREMPVAAGALIVAVTGYGQPEDHECSYRSGIDLHLTKPINVNFLKEILLSYKREPKK